MDVSDESHLPKLQRYTQKGERAGQIEYCINMAVAPQLVRDCKAMSKLIFARYKFTVCGRKAFGNDLESDGNEYDAHQSFTEGRYTVSISTG